MASVERLGYQGPLRAVIVDLAGTTVDFGSCAPAGCFVDLFAKEGITLTLEEARRPMGLNKRDHILELVGLPGIRRQWIDVHGSPPQDSDIARLYNDFIPLQIEVLPRYSRLIPGVLDTLERWAAKGWKVAATTGYNREMMEIVLREVRGQGWVPEVAVCADDVPLGRPAPWLIYQAMMRLNVYPVGSVAVVGDTLADIQAGRSAGVWTLGVTKTGNLLGLDEAACSRLPPEELQTRQEAAKQAMLEAGAHFVADDLAGCTAWLDALHAGG